MVSPSHVLQPSKFWSFFLSLHQGSFISTFYECLFACFSSWLLSSEGFHKFSETAPSAQKTQFLHTFLKPSLWFSIHWCMCHLYKPCRSAKPCSIVWTSVPASERTTSTKNLEQQHQTQKAGVNITMPIAELQIWSRHCTHEQPPKKKHSGKYRSLYSSITKMLFLG